MISFSLSLRRELLYYIIYWRAWYLHLFVSELFSSAVDLQSIYSSFSSGFKVFARGQENNAHSAPVSYIGMSFDGMYE